MKIFAYCIVALGLLSQVPFSNAAGFGRPSLNLPRIGGPPSFGTVNSENLVGQYFSGNSHGSIAFASLQDSLRMQHSALKATSGGAGSRYLDLSGLKYLPEILVIKGGPGYVVLNFEEYTSIWGDNKTIHLRDVNLRNRGGRIPTISHWNGYGKNCRPKPVPEPSSALAGLLALGLGLAGWKRNRWLA